MDQTNQTHWIPLSDLMTGLMMVFMLIAAVYMLRVEQTTTLVIQEYEITREDLLRALQREFENDLKQWNAEFLGDMTLRFKNPDVLFATGSAALKPKFQEILKDFIPRYVLIVTNEKFRPAVKEVRIEGHTSTFWMATTSDQEAYFNNMALSQARTRSTLEFILKLPQVREHEKWLRRHLTANGLSSSRPVFRTRHEKQEVDEVASQRVEFRILTNAEERLDVIAKGLGQARQP